MQGRGALGTVLASTMAASTFMLLVFGVLASDLIAAFGVERWQVGVLVTASSAVAALLSPPAGRLADRVGARRSTIATIAGAAVTLAALGLAPNYLLLLLAAAATAAPQALANPATNKLIAEHVRHGSRGVVTGIKQSGVQVGVFVGGFALPALAGLFGWRAAVVAFAVVWLLFALLARAVLPYDPTAPPAAAGASPAVATADDATTAPHGATTPPEVPGGGRLPPLIRRVTVYGFLLGAGGSTIFTYLDLYAEEALGFSAQAAGTTVALTGLVGIGGRIGWGRTAELRLGALRSLRVIAVLAVLAPVLLLVAGTGPAVLVWPAAVVTGASASAWNAVGMLAIIQGTPASDTGRASGIVMFGFLAGLGLGAPAFGLSVDLTGSYVAGWTGAAVLFVAALGVLATAREPAVDPVPAA